MDYLIDWIESNNLRLGFEEDNSNSVFPTKYKWKCYDSEKGWILSTKSFSCKTFALQDLLKNIEFIDVFEQ